MPIYDAGSTARPEIMGAKVIKVVETITRRGSGKPDDPIRQVIMYWSVDDGTLLAEDDPCAQAGKQEETP